MINRNLFREILKNSKEMYERIFAERGVKFINQYETANFKNLTPDQIKRLNLIKHTWTYGDKYYKLAYKYYGDPKDWWLIAKFNNKPTEAHLKLGDTLLIPTPLSTAIELLRG